MRYEKVKINAAMDLDLSELPQGQYIVKLQSEAGIQIRPLMIIK